jgi:hypothetical protein
MATTGVFRLCLNNIRQLRCLCPMQKVSIHSSVNILPSAVNILPHVPSRYDSLIGSQLHHQKNNFNDFLKTSSGGLLHEYRLPGVGLKKTVIVDPIFSGITEYKDPTFNGVVLDKTVPSSGYASIISDPSPLQRVIDEGAPPISKETRPHMIRIRHWKMKKHKRKKFKKRMLFVLRKKRMLKQKKKKRRSCWNSRLRRQKRGKSSMPKN